MPPRDLLTRKAGYVWLVGAGPGAADLITLRGWRALHQAEVVLHDALIDNELLADLPGEAIDVGKRCGQHAMSQEAITELIVAHAKAGKRVVRLKGGDPTVLGRGGEEAQRLVEEGIAFEFVPGVTSSIAAPELAGIPVTFRGVADSFMVATAHRGREATEYSIPPFHPRTTVVLLMGVKTVEVWQRQLLAHGYPADLPVGFVMSGTMPNQRVVETTVGAAVVDVAKHGVRSPAVAVIGFVVPLRHLIQHSRPPEFARETPATTT